MIQYDMTLIADAIPIVQDQRYETIRHWYQTYKSLFVILLW
jgi:hypothetical protein